MVGGPLTLVRWLRTLSGGSTATTLAAPDPGRTSPVPSRSDLRPRQPFRLRSVHPGLVLAALDIVGLVVASYLSTVELQNRLPYCGPLAGCQQVAQSTYARVFGVPVAVFGVALSVTLLALALAWWRRGGTMLLLGHYALSFVGVLFEVRFTYIQVVVLRAICVWCAIYGLSLVARFLIAFWVWMHRDRYRRALA